MKSLVYIFVISSLAVPAWAQKNSCVDATRFFIQAKAEFETNPDAKFGQVLSTSDSEGLALDVMLGAMIGGLVGTTALGEGAHKAAEVRAEKRLNARLDTIREYYSLQEKLSQEARAQMKAAATRGNVINIGYAIEQSAAAKKLMSLRESKIYKELVERKILPSPQQDRAIRFSKGNIPASQEAAVEAAAKSARVAESAMRGWKWGATSGGIAGVGIGMGGFYLAYHGAKLRLVRDQCGKDLNLTAEQSQALVPFLQVARKKDCEFSPAGAVALANTKDEQLAELCKKVPQLPQIAAELAEVHRKNVAAIAAPKNVKLNCEKISDELVFNTKNENLNCSFSRKDLSGYTVDVSDKAFAGGDHFKFEAKYNSELKIFEEIKSPQIAMDMSSNELTSKNLQEYRRNIRKDWAPVENMQRRAYNAGECLEFAEPLIKIGDPVCEELAAEAATNPSTATASITERKKP